MNALASMKQLSVSTRTEPGSSDFWVVFRMAQQTRRGPNRYARVWNIFRVRESGSGQSDNGYPLYSTSAATVCAAGFFGNMMYSH
jgi:hypothetical protein